RAGAAAGRRSEGDGGRARDQSSQAEGAERDRARVPYFRDGRHGRAHPRHSTERSACRRVRVARLPRAVQGAPRDGPHRAIRRAAGAMSSADVVIVGGGVIGASIAYHLSLRGAGHIVVLERDRLGTGSTGKNAGGIRLQFSTEVNVRLSQLALPRLEAFTDEMGIDPQFRQVGYLFLITEERDVAPFERSLALWRRLGVPALRLSGAEAQAMFPEIGVDDV